MNFIYLLKVALPIILIILSIILFREFFKKNILTRSIFVGYLLSGPLTCYYTPLIKGPMAEPDFLEMLLSNFVLFFSGLLFLFFHLNRMSLNSVFVGFFTLGLTIGYGQRIIHENLQFNYGDVTLLIAFSLAISASIIYFLYTYFSNKVTAWFSASDNTEKKST